MIQPAHEDAAFHEAGHAVMALHHDLRIVEVSLDQLVTTLHADEFERLQCVEETDEASDLLMSHVLVCLAGEQAERLRKERCPSTHLNEQWWALDRDGIADLLMRIAADEEEQLALLRYLEVRARNVLRRRWLVVQNVAEALLTRRSLVGDDVERIWNETTAPPLSPELRASLAEIDRTRGDV